MAASDLSNGTSWLKAASHTHTLKSQRPSENQEAEGPPAFKYQDEPLVALPALLEVNWEKTWQPQALCICFQPFLTQCLYGIELAGKPQTQ